MPSSALALLLTALLQPTAALPTPKATVIERVLAVVDRRPVLLSEVALVERLRAVDQKAALELLIDELLMYAEARRFPQARPTQTEEAAAIESLARLHRTDADQAELKRVAQRQATILKYVGLRFGPLVRISDEDVRQAYEQQHNGRPDAPTLSSVGVELRARLTQRELDARVEEWTRRLRETASIDYFAGDASSLP
jgi:hypothetical protein